MIGHEVARPDPAQVRGDVREILTHEDRDLDDVGKRSAGLAQDLSQIAEQ